MLKREKPENIPMTEAELSSLLDRVKSKTLQEEDYALVEKLIHFVVWMQMKLTSARMTMNKFKAMIFGCKTEKHKKKDKGDKNTDKEEIAAADEVTAATSQDATAEGSNRGELSAQETQALSQENLGASNDADGSTPGVPIEPKKKKGHGRVAADEYTPDDLVEVEFELDELKPGDPCPTQCGGRVYTIPITPGGIIRIYGQSNARVVSYQVHRVRCNLCKDTFTPKMPKEFTDEKYDPHFKAIMVMEKYFLATPFYRQARYQLMQNIRLAPSTQWELSEDVANCSYPVFYVLEERMANGDGIEHDDTHLKILDVMKDNQKNPDKKRTGMYTTGIRGMADGNPVCLYYSGIRHGGENVGNLLSKRDKSLPPIRQMCDALAANVAKEYKTILCNCLAHGRRKFKEIEADFPEECDYILEQLGIVYKNDANAKALNLSAEERLAYHQEYSLPVMNDLWAWMKKQCDEKLVEPNSGLGQAIKYMQNHWEKLTRFLSVAGALLDNNLVEQALKLIIRIRKNAMFHKTEHGAFVAALLVSLVATCELNKKNPIHYLTELQKNKSAVFKQPHLWLPWNYESTLKDTERIAAKDVA